MARRETAGRVALGTAAAALGITFTTLVSGWFTMTCAAPAVKIPCWLVPAIWGSAAFACVFFALLLTSVFKDEKGEQQEAARAAADEEEGRILAEAHARNVSDQRVLVWRLFRNWLLDARARWTAIVASRDRHQALNALMHIDARVSEAVPAHKHEVSALGLDLDDGTKYQWRPNAETAVAAFLDSLMGHVRPWQIAEGQKPEYWDGSRKDDWGGPPPPPGQQQA